MRGKGSATPDDGARLGEHIYSAAEDVRSQFDLIAPMFRAALGTGCQCLYVSDRTPPPAVVARLRERDAEIEEAVESGQFVLATADDLYLRDGYFDPDRVLDAVAGTVDRALTAGCRGLCGAGELSWIGRDVPGTERVLEYEFRLNHMNGLDHAAIVCLYDGSMLPQSVAAELEKVHPRRHRNGRVEVSEQFAADPDLAAELPLLEDLEPSADALPCRFLAELISAAADGELIARRRREMSEHISRCGTCRCWAEAVDGLKQGLQGLRASPAATDELVERLRSRVRSLRGTG